MLLRVNTTNNKKFAKEHLDYVNRKYENYIERSKAMSTIFDTRNINFDYINPALDLFKNKDCTIRLIDADTVSCLFNVINSSADKVGILNFSSYTAPGGLYLDGYKAQEEHLCAYSTLYPVLYSFKNTFYLYNKGNLNNFLYEDRGIYSKGIIFESDMNKNKSSFIKSVDVCTCAAPNLRRFKGNCKDKQKKYGKLTRPEMYDIIYRRLFSVLLQFYANQREYLILGAWGCGVFENDPELIAEVFNDLLVTKFENCFRKVYFAILKTKENSINYDTFYEYFNEVKF